MHIQGKGGYFLEAPARSQLRFNTVVFRFLDGQRAASLRRAVAAKYCVEIAKISKI